MKLSRRDLILRYGPAVTLVWPMLSTSRASAATPPRKRLVTFFSSSGVQQDIFWPTGQLGTYAPGRYSVTGTTLEPLAPYLGDVIIPKGITIDRGDGDSHNAGSVAALTGNHLTTEAAASDRATQPFARGPSLDHYLAPHLSAGLRERMLLFGVRLEVERISKYVSYASDGYALASIQNPDDAYTRIFKPVVDACAGAGTPVVDVTGIKRRSILDVTRTEVAAFKAAVGMDAEERTKLERLEESIRSVERRLEVTPVQPPAAGSGRCRDAQQMMPSPPIVNSDANFPALLDLFLDLVTLGLELDVSRVATLSLSLGGSGGAPMNWLTWTDTDGTVRPIDASHHNITHGTGRGVEKSELKLPVVDKWNFLQFAALIGKLKAVDEGGASLLDNSIVWYASDVAEGSPHSAANMPFIIAGRAGGTLTTGRYVDFGGANHQRLLLSFVQKLGVTDVTEFGRAGASTGGPLL